MEYVAGARPALAVPGAANHVLLANVAVPDRVEHRIVVARQNDRLCAAVSDRPDEGREGFLGGVRDGVERVEDVAGEHDLRGVEVVEVAGQSLGGVLAAAQRELHVRGRTFPEVGVRENERLTQRDGATAVRGLHRSEVGAADAKV